MAHVWIFLYLYIGAQIRGDFAELFKGGFQVFDKFPERARLDRGDCLILSRLSSLSQKMSRLALSH